MVQANEEYERSGVIVDAALLAGWTGRKWSWIDVRLRLAT